MSKYGLFLTPWLFPCIKRRRNLPVGRLGTRRILVYRTQHNLRLPHGVQQACATLSATLLLPVVLDLVL